MNTGFMIITNNPLVKEKLGEDYHVEYEELSYEDTLKKVQKMIFQGYRLLTHPLSGSVKPNETPYKSVMLSETPNHKRSAVSIRSVFESQSFLRMTSPLGIALGKDIAGVAQVADLCKMPHLLIAGSTGSGKSVCVNSIIMSLVFRSSPEDVKLLLIDPKVVELAEYNGIPHLLMPVVTEPRKAAGALGSAVQEMERRYRMFAENNVRDIKSFNKLAVERPDLEKMPYIAIVIDELADLMMVVGKDVEDSICRIAQKARAAGMHQIGRAHV